MELLPFFQQLVFGLFVGGVRYATVNGTDLDTLGLSKPANTLGAFSRVDHINGIAFFYGFVLAFRLTCPTTDAIFGNFICHLKQILLILIEIYFL